MGRGGEPNIGVEIDPAPNVTKGDIFFLESSIIDLVSTYAKRRVARDQSEKGQIESNLTDDIHISNKGHQNDTDKSASIEFNPNQPGPMEIPTNGGDLAKLIRQQNNDYYKTHNQYPTSDELWGLAKQHCEEMDVIYDETNKVFLWGESKKTNKKRFKESCKRYREKGSDGTK